MAKAVAIIKAMDDGTFEITKADGTAPTQRGNLINIGPYNMDGKEITGSACVEVISVRDKASATAGVWIHLPSCSWVWIG